VSNKSVAFIGGVGLPNRYGGFESFLEHVAPVIAAKKNKVYVTCYYSAYKDHSKYYEGVERIFINIKANGVLSPIYDIVGFIKVFRKAKNIVVLGVSAGPLFAIMRLLGYFNKNVIITNIDGVEWRRDKFTKWAKLVLYLFDYLAQIFSNKLVYDNLELKPYIKKLLLSKSSCIPYSGDHVKKYYDVNLKIKNKSALTICRVEPENNIELLIVGALLADFSEYVIIGNFKNSQYGVGLLGKYSEEKKIIMLDSIYDPILINKYRQEAQVYLHGHSVGGTNPSLVEMLYYDCEIFCFDCGFNRVTANERAKFFKNSIELAKLLVEIESIDRIKWNYDNPEYSTMKIAEKYIELLE